MELLKKIIGKSEDFIFGTRTYRDLRFDEGFMREFYMDDGTNRRNYGGVVAPLSKSVSRNRFFRRLSLIGQTYLTSVSAKFVGVYFADSDNCNLVYLSLGSAFVLKGILGKICRGEHRKNNYIEGKMKERYENVRGMLKEIGGWESEDRRLRDEEGYFLSDE